MKYRHVLLIALLATAVIFPPVDTRAETVTNGGITMFNIGDNLVGLLIHKEKKILMYQITVAPNNIALKSVRTWHYDAQYANTIKTLESDGMYPRNLDPKNGPLRVLSYFKSRRDQTFTEFKPDYKIPGLADSQGVGGGDLCLTLESSGNLGVLIILDAKNSALITYRASGQGLEHMGTRTILLDAQIPISYPTTGNKTPLAVRKDLLKVQNDLRRMMKKHEGKKGYENAQPFEVDELQRVIEILEEDDR
jgi:hypothetical protein